MCYFEWSQNNTICPVMYLTGFRSVLFWMITKPMGSICHSNLCFRSVLFWMITKLVMFKFQQPLSFRSVLFWMITKRYGSTNLIEDCFRSVLFWMITKLKYVIAYLRFSFRSVLFWMITKHIWLYMIIHTRVLEVCYFEWLQNFTY